MDKLANYECEGQLSISDIELREPGEYTTYETRAAAHETVKKDIRYRQIIDILKKGDYTAKEVAVMLWKSGKTLTAERNYSAPRLTELSQMGIVEPIGKKTCDYTRKKVAVYHLRDLKEDMIEVLLKEG